MACSCVKAQNICINTVVFPGAMAHPTYTLDRYANSSKFKLIYIPFVSSCTGLFTTCTGRPTAIPALLYINRSSQTNKFCINFHGNACDIGQIAICAEREGKAFDAHYLLVEYPRFGVADGHSDETSLNDVASSVYNWVVREFQLHYSSIVLLGRSIGTGPVCELASQLQQAGTPPAAVILQSPYSSIRDVTADLLGCLSYFLFDRWQNWTKLVGESTDNTIIQCPVLFIHADGDRVINYNHSLLMHEYRSKGGLPSELFVQKSDGERFIKGHNYFDYEKDVVNPSAEFLKRLWKSNFALQSAYDKPIVLSSDVLGAALRPPSRWVGRYTEEQEIALLGNTNVFKSAKCTWDVYAGWLCCPCVSCAESTLALTYHSAQWLFFSTCGYSCRRQHEYLHLRPEDLKQNTLWNVLFRPATFGRHVLERDAADSSAKRKQLIRRSVTPGPAIATSGATSGGGGGHNSNSSNNNKSGQSAIADLNANATKNPLLQGSMLHDSNSNGNNSVVVQQQQQQQQQTTATTTASVAAVDTTRGGEEAGEFDLERSTTGLLSNSTGGQQASALQAAHAAGVRGGGGGGGGTSSSGANNTSSTKSTGSTGGADEPALDYIPG